MNFDKYIRKNVQIKGEKDIGKAKTPTASEVSDNKGNKLLFIDTTFIEAYRSDELENFLNGCKDKKILVNGELFVNLDKNQIKYEAGTALYLKYTLP